MRQEQQVSILKELLHQIESKQNTDAGVQYRMETSAYVCPDMAAREWQTFFREHPQLIGLSGDLPQSGSYFTLDDFGTPVLATRDSEGTFRAFVNACRHRGAQVATEARGKAKLFSCPFHAWSFANDGRLVAVPNEDHFGAVDKSCNGLIELPAVEHAGLLWVHPKPDGKINVTELLGPLADEIESFDLGQLVYAAGRTMDMRLNWKLANDTFGETYHFQKLHKDTLGRVFVGDNLAYEEFGRNHRFVTASTSIHALRGTDESEWKLTERAIVLYFLFPNVQLILNGDRVTLVRIYPDPSNPGRSITRVSAFYPQHEIDIVNSALADPSVEVVTAETVYDFGDRPELVRTPEAVLEVFNSTIENEDYLMGEQQQRSAESGLLPEVIFGRNETPLHHYHNAFRSALGMPPLEQVSQRLVAAE